ncbi:hypothetical protein GC173_15235 [bacterium]|nr:hypothetical protein [bacterium]
MHAGTNLPAEQSPLVRLPPELPTLQRFPLLLRALGLLMLVVIASCSSPAERAVSNQGPPVYVATIKPLALILTELVTGRGEVRTLLSPSASPHTYEPRPSDARAVADAKAFFQVGVGLDDWAASMQATQRIAVMPLLPKEFLLYGACESHDHDHGEAHDGHNHAADAVDAHFWTDPLTTAALVDPLVEKLAGLDPDGAEVYRANGKAFQDRLAALDAELSAELAPVHQAPVVLFHPSFLYMLKRYELRYVGVVEASPGKEATPRHLAALSDILRREGARAVFSEPQLDPRPAEALAREAGVKLAVLDPNGAVEGTETYEALLLFNARSLREALSP